VTRDISERRAAHEALRESERQFRLLVSNVTDYAVIMLDPNGSIASWNRGAEHAIDRFDSLGFVHVWNKEAGSPSDDRHRKAMRS
jgi:PAS domain-containing protein